MQICRGLMRFKLGVECVFFYYLHVFGGMRLLLIDISKSAMRKYARTSSKLASAALMVKTGMRANVLSHIAIFLVEEVR